MCDNNQRCNFPNLKGVVFLNEFEVLSICAENATRAMIIEIDQSNRMLNDFDGEIEFNLNN